MASHIIGMPWGLFVSLGGSDYHKTKYILSLPFHRRGGEAHQGDRPLPDLLEHLGYSAQRLGQPLPHYQGDGQPPHQRPPDLEALPLP